MTILLNLTHGGRILSAATPDDLRARSVPEAEIMAALAGAYVLALRAHADQMRSALYSGGAATLIAMGLHADLAATPGEITAAMQTEIDAIATAEATDVTSLLAAWIATRNTIRLASLTLQKGVSQGLAAISGVDQGAATAEADLATAYTAASGALEAAYLQSKTIMGV